MYIHVYSYIVHNNFCSGFVSFYPAISFLELLFHYFLIFLVFSSFSFLYLFMWLIPLMSVSFQMYFFARFHGPFLEEFTTCMSRQCGESIHSFADLTIT